MKSLSVSEHFQLEQISDGIFAAFAKDSGHAISNAGIINLGGSALIFDTFLSPAAAKELRVIAEQSCEGRVRFVVNSHHHADHIGGNSIFDEGTDIISSTISRSLMENSQEIADYQLYAESHLQELQATSKKETRAVRKHQLESEIRYYQAVVATLPELKVRSSNITFDSRLVLAGKKRTVELIHYGGGHSKSDIILFVPEAKIVFTGDLLSIGYHPYLADGDPGEHDRILNQVAGLGAQMLIPGHGPIGEPNDVRVQRQYITNLTEIAMRELVYGATDAKDATSKARQISIPPTFANWEFPSYFGENLLFLYRRLLAAYAD